MIRLMAVAGTVCTLALATAAGPCFAQNEGARAGKALGSLLFGNPAAEEQARIRGQVDGAIVAEAMARAQESRRQADDAEYTLQMQRALRQFMVRSGVPDDRARAIAAAYRYSPEQAAVIQQARQRGSKLATQDVVDAVNRYDFLLANQIMIGVSLALQDERQPPVK